MSIIYEALKKVEKLQSAIPAFPVGAKKEKKEPRVNTYLLYGIYAGIVVAGFFIASIILSFLTKPLPIETHLLPSKPEEKLASQKDRARELTPAQTPTPQPAALPTLPEPKNEPLPELVLNGLFFSENEGYVLINNHILKEGDEINGAVVKRISLDGVELDSQGSIIKLSNKQ